MDEGCETLNLAPLTKMLTRLCPGCGQRLAVTLAVTAKFNTGREAWTAMAKCGHCGEDLTAVAATMCALGQGGNRHISEIVPSPIWGDFA